jgi:hypothetical protein
METYHLKRSIVGWSQGSPYVLAEEFALSARFTLSLARPSRQ